MGVVRDLAMTTEQLRRYITQHMRMSYVYQPVMLRELLRSDGEASVEQIAKFLSARQRNAKPGDDRQGCAGTSDAILLQTGTAAGT